MINTDGQSVAPTELIASAQNFTAAWADLGDEILTWKYRYLALFLQVDINNTLNARVRILGKTAFAGTLEYTFAISTIGAADIKVEDEYVEFNVDADQNMLIMFKLNGVIPVTQVQIMAGTAGATPGQIDSAYYTLIK